MSLLNTSFVIRYLPLDTAYGIRRLAALWLLIPGLVLLTLSDVPATAQTRRDSMRAVLERPMADSVRLRLFRSLFNDASCDGDHTPLKYPKEYLQLAQKHGLGEDIGQAEQWHGFAYSTCLRDYKTAIYWYERAAKRADASEDTADKAGIFTSIAKCYEYMHEHGKALDYCRLSMATDSRKKKEVLGNMGSIYSSIGDYPNAAASFEQALGIQSRELLSVADNSINDTLNLIGLLISLAEVDVKMKRYDKALQSYLRSQSLNDAIGNKEVSLWVKSGIASCFERAGAYDKATATYEEALHLSREIGVAESETDILNRLGEISLSRNMRQQALAYARDALSVSANQNNRFRAGSYLLLGKVYAASGEYEAAVNSLKQAVQLYDVSGQLDEQSTVWQELSKVYKQMGAVPKEYDAYKHYITLRDSVFSIEKAIQITRTEMKGELDRKLLSDSLQQARKDNATKLHIQRQRSIMYGVFAGLAMVVLLSFLIYRGYRQQKKANAIISKANTAILAEKQMSERLLLNILPGYVAEELKTYGKVKARLFDNVTVLMTDFVGFTLAGERLSPQELVEELHACFEAFDNIVSKYGVEKIKTVGDAYLAICGMPVPDDEHAEKIVRAAIEIRQFMISRQAEISDKTFQIRIGIHTGSVVAGIVGVKKFAYDIWGDTVNTAARMEQNCAAGAINLSETTYELVKDKFSCKYRGEVEAKNKGMLKMYYLD